MQAVRYFYYLRLPVCCLAFFASPDIQAAIYQCKSPTGTASFSQFSCPPGTVSQLYTPEETSLIANTALSDSELDQLRDLEKQLQASRKQNQRSRTRQHKRAAAARSAAEQQCARALSGLVSLGRKRRQGYSAASARTLDRQRVNLEKLKKANCR